MFCIVQAEWLERVEAKVPTTRTLVPLSRLDVSTESLVDGFDARVARPARRMVRIHRRVEHWNNVPTDGALDAPTMEGMNMYVDILSSALEGWVNERTGSALIDDSLVLRVEMLDHRHHWSAPVHEALAAEVAYDRALISLCAEHDVTVDISDFAHPQAERGAPRIRARSLRRPSVRLGPQGTGLSVLSRL